MNIINLIDDDNNVVSCTPKEGWNISFIGDGNKITLHKDLNIGNMKMILGSNMIIQIKKSIHKLENIYIGAMRSLGGGVIIGENFSCVDVQFLLNEKALISIGNDCMFSSAIKLWGSDGHTITNLENNKVLNKSTGIEIGNHVWICENVRILKNSLISDHSVAANSSLICKKFTDSNIVIGGNPAEIIKKGIDWTRETPK